MIYRIIVNATFLAVGYCIGRAVSQNLAAKQPDYDRSGDDDEQSPAATDRHEEPPDGED